MKYINVFVWMFILGEVMGYLGSALLGLPYDATKTSLVAAIVGTLGAIAIPALSKAAVPEHKHSEQA